MDDFFYITFLLFSIILSGQLTNYQFFCKQPDIKSKTVLKFLKKHFTSVHTIHRPLLFAALAMCALYRQTR